MNNKHKRIESKKNKIGSRHRRKLKKFSKKFNTMFSFFLELNRKGLITFCGSKIEIKHDVNGLCSKEVFRLYEDGQYKNGKDIITRVSKNMVKHQHLYKLMLVYLPSRYLENILLFLR